ncbi:MAG TPA: UDP-glucose/GDP-mannose dehydrogenase family protein [Sedimentisphaerales bacterium]|jgi:UDPglucose 6-dehydrogenase|nr:UDP-glucose/GDP-mannose dehydrogenase family protein [Sedimentisphaerales bacterium]HNU29420.1 UDP-glucose/GDP-mannose dehydrogenase family protein [Sedimentisphaerales bacterium]
MRLCVVGVGYVGLVSGACFAEAGNQVICVDSDAGKIEALRRGEIPIYERGLEEIVRSTAKAGRLHFTTDLKEGVSRSEILILAVGTPMAPDGSADLRGVYAAAGEIAGELTDYRVIVMKSTVPVGTHETLTRIIQSRASGPFDYVSNPEFLKEGAAVEDFMRPDRIIIGTTSPRARDIMAELYKPFMRKSKRIIFMDPASAEMAKYAANGMLATRVSFMNEISLLCERMGADVELVRQGLGSDSRIGSAFLFPGIGFGGSCFPKDIHALIHMGQTSRVDMPLAGAVWQVNIAARDHFAERVIQYFADRQSECMVAVWGLAFKANTDDIRESPAVYCVRKFLESGIKVRAYDPQAGPAAAAATGGAIELHQDPYAMLDHCDALVVLTDWPEFRTPDFQEIRSRLKRPVVFDGRNLYDPDHVARAGIKYFAVGRPASPLRQTVCPQDTHRSEVG